MRDRSSNLGRLLLVLAAMFMLLLVLSERAKGGIAYPVQLPRLPSGGATTGMCLVRGPISWGPAICFRGASQTFTAQTTVTFTHNLGSTNLTIRVVDNSGNRVRPKSATIVNANTVQVVFDSASSGRVIVK